MEAWTAAAKVPGLLPAGSPPPLPDGGTPPPAADAGFGRLSRSDVQNKKLIAGICGIVVGSLGVHKFILGMTTPGVIMLVITLASAAGAFLCFPIVASLAVWAIGLIEGIIYLTKSDEEFYQTYIVHQKEWF
jgi:TM2 domain-containing membrane protein YozV